MDAILLSRIQFAAATVFHFFFVPLTLGLPLLTAILETRYVRTGNENYRRHAKFWGTLVVINFVVGVATGLTLEFQFGTNWAKYSKYVGDVFGPLLAIESTASFFLESTFVAVWIFGWKKLSPRMHATAMWLVWLAAVLSAVWILLANGWMQAPQGHVIRNNRAELANFWDLIFNAFSWHQIVHTIAAGFVTSGFFMLGVSAYKILRSQQPQLFRQSYKLGATTAILASVIVVVHGHINGEIISQHQPTKLAAMEPTWDTTTWAPLYIFCIPDQAAEKNHYEFGKIPGMLSFLAYRTPEAKVVGLKEFPREDRPPVLWTFIAFRVMILLGFLFIFLSWTAWFIRKEPQRHPWVLRALIIAIPLPYLAAQAGWIMTEVGRQPWIVWGLLRTKQAASDLSAGQVLTSLVAMCVVYTFLGITAWYLMARTVWRGMSEKEMTKT